MDAPQPGVSTAAALARKNLTKAMADAPPPVTPRKLMKRQSRQVVKVSNPQQIQQAATTEVIKGVVVLDNGTGQIKAGFAGEDQPRKTVSSIVGRKKVKEAGENGLIDETDTHFYLGDEAQARRGELLLTHPMEHGIVQDWDQMERLWDYMFAEQLNINIEEFIVLMTEPPMNPTKNREKIAETMFEGFNVPGLFVGMQALLALYSEGLTTGLVLDIGDGVTHVVPVYEGYGVSSSVLRQDLAGRDLTDYMLTLMRERGYIYNTSAQREVVREVKEKLCYVAMDFEGEAEAADKNPSEYEKTLELPDGETIVLADQRFRCAEPLFQPEILGKDLVPLPELIIQSLKGCAIDTRKPLMNSVLISGGTTMFRGFSNRLRKEINNQLPTSMGVRSVDVNIIAPAKRQHCVWRGGSVLGALSTFEDMVVTWEDYDEVGADIMNKKSMDFRNL